MVVALKEQARKRRGTNAEGLPGVHGGKDETHGLRRRAIQRSKCRLAAALNSWTLRSFLHVFHRTYALPKSGVGSSGWISMAGGSQAFRASWLIPTLPAQPWLRRGVLGRSGHWPDP